MDRTAEVVAEGRPADFDRLLADWVCACATKTALHTNKPTRKTRWVYFLSSRKIFIEVLVLPVLFHRRGKSQSQRFGATATGLIPVKTSLIFLPQQLQGKLNLSGV